MRGRRRQVRDDRTLANGVRLERASTGRMSGLAWRDTGPEIVLRRALHQRGLRYYVHRRPLPELRRETDVVFPKAKLAVFVDGCFWHGCPADGRRDHRTNGWYWPEKIERNKARPKTLMPSCVPPDGFPFECGSTRNLKARPRGFFFSMARTGSVMATSLGRGELEPSATLLPLIPRISRGRCHS